MHSHLSLVHSVLIEHLCCGSGGSEGAGPLLTSGHVGFQSWISTFVGSGQFCLRGPPPTPPGKKYFMTTVVGFKHVLRHSINLKVYIYIYTFFLHLKGVKHFGGTLKLLWALGMVPTVLYGTSNVKSLTLIQA